MRTNYLFKLSTVIAIILPLFFLIQTTGLQTASAIDNKYAADHQQARGNVPDLDKKQTERKLTHKKVNEITKKFEDLLVQETDDNFKVINYRSKNDLLDTFEEIALREVAARYVDFYFYEKQNDLYIVPTELPPWLNEENDYDMIQLEENKVKVVQKNKSNFHGDYTVAFEFTFDNEWRITDIVYS
ncbi:hypothetical protein [Virgibacillus ndiopensis]|uniref:hypothetical protein n=1 Tax=Virgibacillus ndiopensis TaxID=2004408 RepID=UPI000C08A8D4|nr:hypothetical protein [Virgibacillus ndiopensis]